MLLIAIVWTLLQADPNCIPASDEGFVLFFPDRPICPVLDR
ncbi:hypothetical protein [Geobacter sp. SVR]|nr:hypothetical protein [Geobacter sp. SVR]BCS54532.1 hypothetical protein GSVR_28400 [Geobacter sp. SVR]GCF87132.1 hypothetical protein GSbR_37320 [Geobacter sp. SVR]